MLLSVYTDSFSSCYYIRIIFQNTIFTSVYLKVRFPICIYEHYKINIFASKFFYEQKYLQNEILFSNYKHEYRIFVKRININVCIQDEKAVSDSLHSLNYLRFISKFYKSDFFLLMFLKKVFLKCIFFFLVLLIP